MAATSIGIGTGITKIETEASKSELIDRLGVRLDVVQRAYGWTIGRDNHLYGLVAGDMGYEDTGIVIDDGNNISYSAVEELARAVIETHTAGLAYELAKTIIDP
jgi:hypothetical protein